MKLFFTHFHHLKFPITGKEVDWGATRRFEQSVKIIRILLPKPEKELPLVPEKIKK